MLQPGSRGEERECYERKQSEHSAGRNTDQLSTACPKSLSYFHHSIYSKAHWCWLNLLKGASATCFSSQPPKDLQLIQLSAPLKICDYVIFLHVWWTEQFALFICHCLEENNAYSNERLSVIQTTTEIIGNAKKWSWAANQRIIMISEGSCDTEEWWGRQTFFMYTLYKATVIM